MEFLQFAEGLAKEAGGIIRENFSLGMTREWKEDGTPLTISDEKINRLVIERVQELFPDHSVLGEEESYEKPLAEYTWVCDPIDGTIPFSHGFPNCVFSLGLCKNGEPIVGVIYDPHLDRLLSAERGLGAKLNGVPVKVSNASALDCTVIAVDGPPSSVPQIGDLYLVLNKRRVLTLTHRSICYSGMFVGFGEFAAVIAACKTPWDAAALAVIVPEAGGKFSSLSGEVQRYDRPINGFIASNGILHDELVEIVKEITR